MKRTILPLILMLLVTNLMSQTIQLNTPDTNRGLPVMKALKQRSSASKFDTSTLKLQDISDLCWAANGVNRPASGKRTAPSAMNAQEIDVYVFLRTGAYLYDAAKNALNLIAPGDNRKLCAGQQEFAAAAPVICVLVADISKFKFGNDSVKIQLAGEDAGIVSENISLFCAGTGLATRPRATMDQKKLHDLLKLKPSQYLLLNNPVSYKKD
jgi:SagB-type dehydrogenase family enzyme